MLSCPNFAGACGSCIQEGRDCSSISELADIPAECIKLPSVFGAGRDAGRIAGILAELSILSERIQLGKSFSSIEPGREYADSLLAGVGGRSLLRKVSNHAGNSGCFGAYAFAPDLFVAFATPGTGVPQN